MIVILLLILINCILSIQLLRYRKELNTMAKLLEETSQESNLRLGSDIRSLPILRLCRAMNSRLEAGQEAQRKSEQAQKELKFTISCVSHDIRTPLTGASGYLQLLKECRDSEKESYYRSIIAQKLKDLEELLDMLFLYAKLNNTEYNLTLKPVYVFPALCEAIAEKFDRLEAASIEPDIQFEDETMVISGEVVGLKRIFGNLTDNALKYGTGTLSIRQAGHRIIFENQLFPDNHPDPDRMFDHFWQADAARKQSGSGLGLSVVKQLTEKMDGKVCAEIKGDNLRIILIFP